MTTSTIALPHVLSERGFSETSPSIWEKPAGDTLIRADLTQLRFQYPDEVLIGHRGVLDASLPENCVVFECVARLLNKGYPANSIVLEPRWQVGHGSSGGRADIQVKDANGASFLIIECKTYGYEFEKEWRATLTGSGQVFTYAHQESNTQYVALYASSWQDGNVESVLRLISVTDNDEYLEAHQERGEDQLTYGTATDASERWRAWKETYQGDYATFGLFDEGVPPYQIGLTRTLADLRPVRAIDTGATFSTFANIMRQHNVSGRENAFDKLVNLLLAKIVDERESAGELEFYWRGAAFDDPFALQDRLARLYAQGMKKFLNEEVTYVEESEIQSAFRLFQADPDATKDAVLEVFRKLKYFTNSDLAFIEVHNRRLFGQNSEILISVVKMLQDLRVRTREHNQFLGDLFEGFLDQGVHQSEGQFFTPVPIVKFLVTALPAQSLLKRHGRPLRVIDFACGAGHFLNEYATNLSNLGITDPEELSVHNREIVGIEKEYRLSKVAKVSAFMYGQDDIQIVYADALASPPAGSPVEDDTFDVLVANPPYSVRGFLETLSPSDRKRFTLMDFVDEKSLSSVGTIEAFFIERASQLLSTGGVAAIVMPASILTTSTKLAVATRTLLYERFQVIALVELGPDTFGKTPTSTVTMFLRRREEPPEQGAHARNRVEAWFNADVTKDAVFGDREAVDLYCAQIGAAAGEYRRFMATGRIASDLIEIPVFAEYKNRFLRTAVGRKAWDELPKDDQEIVPSRLLATIRDEEKERLATFLLASNNDGPVAVVRFPKTATERKKFLGYEWSSARGNEGIHYLGMSEPLAEDELTPQSQGIMSILTPLFDPRDLNSEDKLNTVIRAAFEGKQLEHPQVERYALTDMIDFQSAKFGKTITLSPSSVAARSEMFGGRGAMLGNLAETSSGLTVSASDTRPEGEVRYVRITDIDPNGKLRATGGAYISTAQAAEARRLVPGDVLISRTGESAGKFVIITKDDLLHSPAVFASFMIRVGTNNGSLNPEFFWYFMHTESYRQQVLSLRHGASQPQFPANKIRQVRVPDLKPDAQAVVVKKCRKLQRRAEKAAADLNQINTEVTFDPNWPTRPLRQLYELDNVRALDDSVGYLGLEDIDPQTGKVQLQEGMRGATAVAFNERHVLWTKLRPNLRKVALPDGPGRGSTEVQPLLPSDDVTREYLFFVLRSSLVNDEAVAVASGVRMPRAAISRLDHVLVPVPPKGIQEAVTKELISQLDSVQQLRDEKARAWASISNEFDQLF